MPDHQQIDELTSFAHELADAASRVTLPHFRAGTAVEGKTDTGRRDFDPVTAADRDGETAMRKLIAERYPEHGIFGEEHGRQEGTSKLSWVLDPIDGTRSFVCGVPLWGTLVALNDGERPLIGVMDQPYIGERFTGRPGGSTLNGPHGTRPLKTSQCTELSQALLGCTDPAMFDREDERKAFKDIASRVKLRRFGGDCYFYCLLAAGAIDLVVESAMQPYDIQALIPIIENAGGIVTSWAGKDAQMGGQILAAATPELHKAAMGVLAPAADR